MTKFTILSAAVFLSIVVSDALAQTQAVSFEPEHWDIQARESKVVDHLGRRSLYLKGGVAVVKNSHFTDGVIDFDLAMTGERGFMGAAWRLQDADNYEEFYIRPHQSGNPDANQYQPVFNGVAAWQLYHGEGYGAPVKYDFNQWIHIRIVVSGQQAEVYIKDLETPALFISELKRDNKPGKVGLSAGNFSPGYYSNFSFTPTKNPLLKGKSKPPVSAPQGTVMSWMISAAFDGKTLEGKYKLNGTDKDKLTWRKLAVENTGVANLARVQGVGDNKNTVFARLIIQSDTEQVKKLSFGFSDAVKAYFNDRLIYGGTDIYQSRDYRFLGTIGLFDELYLPLKKGDNELWIAVTENFGGWGIKAQFENTDGLRLKE